MLIWVQPYIILDGNILRCSACNEPLRGAKIVEQFKRHIADKHPNPNSPSKAEAAGREQ
jgi:hypothetical protein